MTLEEENEELKSKCAELESAILEIRAAVARAADSVRVFPPEMPSEEVP